MEVVAAVRAKGGGDWYIDRRRTAEEAKEGVVVTNPEPVVPAGATSTLYTQKDAARLGLATLTKETRQEVAEAYGLGPASLRDDPLMGRNPVACLIDVRGAVTDGAGRVAQTPGGKGHQPEGQRPLSAAGVRRRRYAGRARPGRLAARAQGRQGREPDPDGRLCPHERARHGGFPGPGLHRDRHAEGRPLRRLLRRHHREAQRRSRVRRSQPVQGPPRLAGGVGSAAGLSAAGGARDDGPRIGGLPRPQQKYRGAGLRHRRGAAARPTERSG